MIASPLLTSFAEAGYVALPDLIPSAHAVKFREALLAMRTLDASLFLAEEEWERSPKTHERTNPGPGYNVIEKMVDRDPSCLAFVEENPTLRQALAPLLGENFVWLKKKIVHRMPRSLLPSWLRPKLEGRLSNTLNAFIRPEFRDIAYYLEHDFHQDIIDWNRMPNETRDHRIITLYIHLDDVLGEDDAPLVMLPGTHRFGATPYQHDVRYLPESKRWAYTAGDRRYETESRNFYGHTGSALVFHSLLLHAAHTIRNGRRLILRYTLTCGKEPCGLDAVNRSVEGPLFLETDYNAGRRVGSDGIWNLEMTDFVRRNPG